MIIINHRINSILELQRVPSQNGIEIDVRYHDDELILNHEPFNHHINQSTKLIELLSRWNKIGPIILNLKTEGIEDKCIQLMGKYKVKDWFFLDMSMPILVKYSDKAKKKEYPYFSPKNLAVRFSDREPIEYALSFRGRAKWVWVDYFSNFPLNEKIVFLLKNAGFKICLVSPEIQKDSIFNAYQLADICSNFKIDAVCTKEPEPWLKFVN